MLSRNIGPYPNIQAFPIALGPERGVVRMRFPDDPRNFGGFSIADAASDRTPTIAVEMRTPRAVLAELGITRVDVAKVDCEGAEHDILTGLDPAVLRSIRWITGELHGERDAALLRHLSRWFHLRVTKSPGARLSKLDACNKTLERR